MRTDHDLSVVIPKTAETASKGSLETLIRWTLARLIWMMVLVYSEIGTNLLLAWIWIQTNEQTLALLLLVNIGLTFMIQFFVGINSENGDKFSCKWGIGACAQFHLIRMSCALRPYHPLMEEKFNNFHMGYFLSSFWQAVLKLYLVLSGEPTNASTLVQILLIASAIISLSIIMSTLSFYVLVSQRVSCIVDAVKLKSKLDEHTKHMSAANILSRDVPIGFTRFIEIKWAPLPHKSFTIPVVLYAITASYSRCVSFIILMLSLLYVPPAAGIGLLVMFSLVVCCAVGKALSHPPYVEEDEAEAEQEEGGNTPKLEDRASRSSVGSRNRGRTMSTASVVNRNRKASVLEDKTSERGAPCICMSIVGWLDVIFPFWTMKTLFITGWHPLYNTVGVSLRMVAIARDASSVLISSVWCIAVGVVRSRFDVAVAIAVVFGIVAVVIDLRASDLSVEQKLHMQDVGGDRATRKDTEANVYANVANSTPSLTAASPKAPNEPKMSLTDGPDTIAEEL